MAIRLLIVCLPDRIRFLMVPLEESHSSLSHLVLGEYEFRIFPHPPREREKSAQLQSSGGADDLERYLLENGFMDQLDILTQGDIFLRLQAFLSGTRLSTSDAEQFINRILVGLPN